MEIGSEVFEKVAMHLAATQLLAGPASTLPRAREIVIASDYVDEAGPFQTLSFAVASAEGWRRWRGRRDRWRTGAALHGRRISYKKLNARHSQRVIDGFLDAAGALNGTLFTIAVDRRIPSLFKESGKLVLADFEVEALPITPAAMERVMRIAYSVVAGVSGLAPHAETVYWLTDDDAVVNNAGLAHGTFDITLDALRSALGRDVRLVFGAPRAIDSDDDRLLWEDLLALPDLSAGALAALLASGLAVSRSGIIVPVTGGSEKAKLIGRWLAAEGTTLQKVLGVIRDAGRGESTIDWARFVPMAKPKPSIPVVRAGSIVPAGAGRI